MLARSFSRKVAATVGAAVGFVWLYQVTILDSRYAARQALIRESTASPIPGARLRFSATAYCKGTTTYSGVAVRTGIAAADPELLPVGSVIQIDRMGAQYNGVYTVMDVGPAVKGRELDVYMWSCIEALRFGSRSVLLTVLRLGWNPRASTPELIDLLFRRRDRALSSRPLSSQPLAGSESRTDAPSAPSGSRLK